MAAVDSTLPSKTYDKLISPLSRRHASLLFQLRTNHVPLQTYLAHIGKATVGTCPTCHTTPETVAHFLLVCPTYSLHRALHFRSLGYSGRTLPTLLNSADAIRPKFCTDPRANPLDEVRRRILDWIHQWNWAHRWSTDSPMITTAIDSEVSFADLKHPF